MNAVKAKRVLLGGGVLGEADRVEGEKGAQQRETGPRRRVRASQCHTRTLGIARWAKVLAAKPGDLSSVPEHAW